MVLTQLPKTLDTSNTISMSFDTDNNFSSLQFLESSVSKNDLIPNIITGSSSAGHSQRVSNATV